jgi:hypothetical protein
VRQRDLTVVDNSYGVVQHPLVKADPGSIDRAPIPRTVWAIVVLQLVGLSISLVWHDHGVAAKAFDLVGEGVLLFLFLRGLRAVWVLALIGSIFGLVGPPVVYEAWSAWFLPGMCIALASLCLLLTPSVRHYFAKPVADETGRT